MTRRSRILLGILSLWPLFYVILLIAMVVNILYSTSRQPLLSLGATAVLHVVTFFLVPSLIAYYVRFIKESGKVPGGQHTKWVLLTIFGNVVVFPYLWYRFIRTN